MKKVSSYLFLTIPTVIFLLSCEQNQKEQIPENIKVIFEESNPDAKDVEWSLKEDSYEVNYEDANRKVEVEYSQEGKLLQEEIIIDAKDLPDNIKAYLQDKYPQLHIGEASIEEKKGEKVYELELLNGFFREIELEFDIDGNFLRKETFKD